MTCRLSFVFAAWTFTLAASGCILHEPGTEVELAAASVTAADPRAGLTSDRGYYVKLDSLYLVLGRVELVPCSDPSRWARFVELLGPSIARAHGLNSPTVWAVPSVLAPLSDRESISLAVLRPPATEYCAVRVSLQAADQDAERMPSEVELTGHSMYVAGSYGVGQEGGSAHFAYQSASSTSTELPIVDRAGQPTVLSLSEENLRVTLRIELAYTRLFDGIPLIPGEYEPVGDIVLSRALDHVAVVVVDQPD